MGVVWRARDTSLERDVAIKVLPEVAADADRLARFEREARLLAQLEHPNIASIYGLHESPSTGSEQAGVRFLAMELVEGEDLAERLKRGPMTVDEAVAVTRQGGRRSRARACRRRDPPRPETGQRDADARRQGEGARLRPGQGVRGGQRKRRGQPVALTHRHLRGHRGRCAAGHRGLHEPRAGSRSTGRPPLGHLGAGLRAVRDADSGPAVPRPDHLGHAGRGAQIRPRLERATGRSSGGCSPRAASVPREESGQASARRRRRADPDRAGDDRTPGGGRRRSSRDTPLSAVACAGSCPACAERGGRRRLVPAGRARTTPRAPLPDPARRDWRGHRRFRDLTGRTPGWPM